MDGRRLAEELPSDRALGEEWIIPSSQHNAGGHVGSDGVACYDETLPDGHTELRRVLNDL